MLAQLLAVQLNQKDLSVVRNVAGNMQVLTAGNSSEALHLMEMHASIDMVLIDIERSYLQSLQLLHTLVYRYQQEPLRIIVLGEKQLLQQKKRVFDLDLITVLNKPIQEKQLRGLLELEVVKQDSYSEQQNVLEKAHLFNAIFYQAPIGISISYRVDLGVEPGKERFVGNPMYEKITGRSMEEILRIGWTAITHPDDLPRELEYFKRLKRGELESYTLEKRFIRPDGSIVWVEMTVAPLQARDSRLFAHISLFQDITKRKEAERLLAESERSKSALLSHLPGMAYRCLYDTHWTMLFVSAGCESLTGYTPDQLIHNRDISYNDIIVISYRQKIFSEWSWAVQENKPFVLEYEILTAQGTRKWVWEMGQAVYTDGGDVEALEGIILDITNRKQMEQNLAFRDAHDLWTGLYNRRYLEQLLLQDIKAKKSTKRALVSINLGALNAKSMAYGYQYSQDIMKKVAEGLLILCNKLVVLSITHEYQLVFYLRSYHERQNLLMLCKKIESTLEHLLVLERIPYGLGVLEINDSNQDAIDQLLRNLLVASQRSVALYDGEAKLCFFDESMETEILWEAKLTEILASIVSGRNQESLFLQYQPIVDMRTRRICGFEALARLKCKDMEMIPPLQFIPIAEKTKLIIPLGNLIIRQAFQFLKQLEDQHVMDCTVSINISALQVIKEGFAEHVIRLMHSMDVNPSCICLELTESIFASNFQEINRVLKTLRSKGVKISVDDFGSGYSSLSRERELYVDELKIDKSFIDKLLFLSDDQAITGDIISMAHKLGHNVVAEGIEHQRQFDYLKRNNCDKAQGFLFSKPLDATDAIALVARNDAHRLFENLFE
ncbi:EAL domain-containing protein [Sphaerochaeta halotolerans]|uniref:EAL domain-containing protein n=1 Tax=Sphaerochaeta halotolerans TaxID=2293840 RepID=A0A372MJN2_9SPIR|nr:EAL domain-containing protein [Sphaerochaeta halotolerans]RFU95588.1 EAL domain-containing protein [Sphaerochaeta halotolerans]